MEGLEVYLVVEPPKYSDVNVGHTFVVTGTGQNLTVWTYGRYAELGKEKGPSNATNRFGEGVLIKLTGQDALNMVEKYIIDYNSGAYEMIDANQAEVDKYFQTKFDASDKLPTKGKYKGDPTKR